MSLKVCILAGGFPPTQGGVAHVAHNLLKYTRARGIRSTILTSAATDQSEDGVRRLSKGATGFLFRQFLQGTDIMGDEYDILHFQGNNGFGLLPSLVLDKKRRGCKILVTLHVSNLRLMKRLKSARSDGVLIAAPHYSEYLAKFVKYPANILADIATTRTADRFTCVSEATRRDCSEDYGISKNLMSVIYNGVDIERFNPEIKGTRVFEEHRLIDKEIVLFVGKLQTIKGVHWLLCAMKDVLRSRPDAALILVGNGKCERKLRSLASKLRISESVVFAGPQDVHLSEYFAASTLVVIPSEHEGFPLVALEAMASGKPMVASSVGGLPEIVTQDTGILVRSGDFRDLGSAISELLGNDEMCDNMGREARIVVERRFDWNIVASQYILEYEKLLASER